MSEVFLIHAGDDAPRIAPIIAALKSAGIDVASGSGPESADAARDAKISLVAWTTLSTDADRGKQVVDLAEVATGADKYVGMLLDEVELPFGFGGHQAINVAPFRGSERELHGLIDSVKRVIETGPQRVAPLAPPPPPPKERPNLGLYIGIGVVVTALVAGIAWFIIRGNQPTTGDLVQAQLGAIPCAWLRVDPVQDGADGTVGITGVAADPAAAKKIVEDLVAKEGLPINAVANDKVAQIDGRECAAIDEPRRLRKTAGGRLIVTGEPFILDTSLPKPQALTRVQINLDPGKDKTMALFGVEPSGVVTWALPDLATMDMLKDADVGYVKGDNGRYEFNIYPDHLGWTGLFVVVGDRELIAKLPQGTVQSSREFAATLRKATAEGTWDADMVWFRIDPK